MKGVVRLARTDSHRIEWTVDLPVTPPGKQTAERLGRTSMFAQRQPLTEDCLAELLQNQFYSAGKSARGRI